MCVARRAYLNLKGYKLENKYKQHNPDTNSINFYFFYAQNAYMEKITDNKKKLHKNNTKHKINPVILYRRISLYLSNRL